MFKRFISIILVLSALLALIPAGVVSAADDDLTEISNQYIKVIVNNKNGGYVISTLEGDILKKSDNNAFLTHRGEYYDTSFTSFKVGDDECVRRKVRFFRLAK
jgi:c-di-AMP phosphodiesterase-like protein